MNELIMLIGVAVLFCAAGFVLGYFYGKSVQAAIHDELDRAKIAINKVL